MTERERIAHLLRRFGLGAGRYQLKPYEALGYLGALTRLLDDGSQPEGFPISHWEIAAQEDGRIDPNAYHVGISWALRFLLTRRPLQEKLTLFWHDHFALDAEKVFEAPLMLGYLDALRTNGRGKYRDLLHAVVKQGALLGYLDNHTSNRISPNENFARELLELFTVGEGNFTESDVKDTARAFTGWSLHFAGYGLDTPFEQLRDKLTRHKMSVSNFCVVPALHDDGEKTILGRKGRFDGSAVLDLLADHPATARFVCRKLWAWFAYPDPEPAVVERLTGAWRATGGEIRAVLRAIAESPEFLSDRCVRTLPKSPLDWTVALFRNFDLAPFLLLARGAPKGEFEPLKKDLREAANGIFYLMAQQGLTLLFPPNVGGWDWGPAWITTQNSIHRANHADVVFWGADRGLSAWIAAKLKSDDQADSAAKVVDGLADILDVPLDPGSRDVLIELCARRGGVQALDSKDSAAGLFAGLARAMFSIPRFQLA